MTLPKPVMQPDYIAVLEAAFYALAQAQQYKLDLVPLAPPGTFYRPENARAPAYPHISTEE
ncbi:hypothetical protein LHT11_10660 [Acetobacter indonesiensis]|uniref:hypothetical protein n=1 Tax=Acetobacter indonesiensis TaxID=104101 RepID=UPI001F2E829D|nr:hypothetical protein [Acetobacter indonesiensis]MCG0995663.1 hypothetical protein [Acetobacter indonesiensis]